MKRLLIVCCVAGMAKAAYALPIDVDGCHNLDSASTSCTVRTRGAQARYEDGSRDCLGTATQGFACRFSWPTADPAALTPTVWWNTTLNGATSGSVCFRAAIACATVTNNEYDNISFGSAVAYSAVLPGGFTPGRIAVSTFAGALTPNAHAPGALCWLKFERAIGVSGCTDNIPDANGSGASIKKIDLQ